MNNMLFKGKQKENNIWVEGSPYKGTLTETPWCLDDCKIKIGIIINGVVYECFPESVVQYSGLEDKTNNKIFYTDIVKYKDQKWVFEYSSVKQSAFIRNSNGFEVFYPGMNKKIEVVGNILDCDNAEELNG